MKEYSEEYYAFRLGDKVEFTSNAQTNGHTRIGVITGIWTGKPFRYPFSVKYESPIYPGKYIYAWAHPSELKKV